MKRAKRLPISTCFLKLEVSLYKLDSVEPRFNFINRPHSGRGEIRTRERIAPLPVLQTGAFGRSATLPLLTLSIFYIPRKVFILSSTGGWVRKIFTIQGALPPPTSALKGFSI